MTAFSPLTLRSEALTAHILPFGAALVGLHLAGGADNLVLGFADPQDHARIPVYAGAVVGPVANRIAGGRLRVAGQTHQMPRNEGDTCLHSGPEGLHARHWEVRAKDAARLCLGLTLPDGACGLPGKREITAQYALAGDTLTLALEATTDRLTAMNLAHHPYWTLDGRGDVSTHRLDVAATHVLAVDAQGLPTGKLRPVAGTALDFRCPRPVPRDAPLDRNYCLSDASLAVPRHVATLTGATGTALQITTDAPGLQVYNGAFLPATKNALPGGRGLRPFHAMALEPQYWPDAPNNPQFPQIMLAPGQLWRQTTCYRLATG
ncbi:Aldose 1-epimerase precursor [Sulfitobacter sp. THAF37]|uniref:aldose epimerase family protein n=1 Tax=Sulfitobacter sp. THAF37 TaxID=2587855 RepID=UPI001268770C|nr:aldose epimerase family protein [Sulfitobacter sp. THAF37]QFT59790.1 Aldose 1-epimerase precursor [Sulfitobacter sp. THAF37]